MKKYILLARLCAGSVLTLAVAGIAHGGPPTGTGVGSGSGGGGGTSGVCIWSSLPSGSSNQCTNESCGHGCSITSYGPYVTQCYTGGYPSPGCCICTWQTFSCQCLLGSGSGVSSATAYYTGAQCVPPSGPGTTYQCVDEITYKPLPTPYPAGAS